MGTYLNLELKDKREKHINAINQVWKDYNPGFENMLRFLTRADIRKDIEYIKTDRAQAHLRYIKTVKEWDKVFPVWSTGTFQIKITLGDYLCSEMARRYLEFVEKLRNEFIEFPDNYVISILQETARENRIAEECNCKSCKSEGIVNELERKVQT